VRTILITGGAGFVGSNLSLSFKRRYPGDRVICFDNLFRRGSELNLPDLRAAGIEFVRGDVRCEADLRAFSELDLIIECSAEPSVLAGSNSSAMYLIETNLMGAVNCFELAKKTGAAVIFLSTSRVYPFDAIEALRYGEEETRFVPVSDQNVTGLSPCGISESFSLDGIRSLYGATKLSAEHLLREYCYLYGVKGVINRCSVIAGPRQMGRADQGIFSLWLARHMFGQDLGYIGYGGTGKQVRDFLHVDDLFDLLERQISRMPQVSGTVYNVGGGVANALSLCELTDLCRGISGNNIAISSDPKNRYADMRWFVTDNAKVSTAFGWTPSRSVDVLAHDVARWIEQGGEDLRKVLM